MNETRNPAGVEAGAETPAPPTVRLIRSIDQSVEE
jgi:hypothetical protein